MAAAEAQAQLFAELLGPGGDFEMLEDSWPVGMPGHEKIVTMRCFGGPKVPKTMREFYDQCFTRHTDKTFLVFEEERWTFGQVWEAASALGSQLVSSMGIEKGDRVSICMRNYPEWCIAFVGVTAVGAIAVPLNGWWKDKELEYGLADSGSKALVCDEERLGYASNYIKKTGMKAILVRPKNPVSVPGVQLWDDVQAQGKGAVCPPSKAITDDYCTIMYTSGTTGHPKGVVQTHRGITNQLTMALVVDEIGRRLAPPEAAAAMAEFQDCVICPVPLFHVTASHHIFLSAVVSGRKLVLMYKWDAGKALQLIERERATGWTGVPTMVNDLMEHPDFHKYDTSSLKSVGGGGAPTPKSQVFKSDKAFKNAAPSQGYGLTETNGAVCSISGDVYKTKPTSCGQPFPHVDVAVVDPDTGKRMAVGQRGELLMRSPLVLSHYWNKKEKTDEAIIELDELGPGWFRSGDIAEVDEEGFIYIRDRAKDIIIRGGENISCAEVESAFFEAHPDLVLECAAFGIKDERLGEVVGLMVLPKPNSGVSMSGAMLVEKVKGKLAAFKIPLPDNVFFTGEPLPRGATGKTLKRTIRDKVNSELAAGKRVTMRAKL